MSLPIRHARKRRRAGMGIPILLGVVTGIALSSVWLII